MEGSHERSWWRMFQRNHDQERRNCEWIRKSSFQHQERSMQCTIDVDGHLCSYRWFCGKKVWIFVKKVDFLILIISSRNAQKNHGLMIRNVTTPRLGLKNAVTASTRWNNWSLKSRQRSEKLFFSSPYNNFQNVFKLNKLSLTANYLTSIFVCIEIFMTHPQPLKSRKTNQNCVKNSVFLKINSFPTISWFDSFMSNELLPWRL